LPLVESGAADHFRFDSAELALACSSHGGEPVHTDSARRLLARIGLDENALECGPHAPLHAPTAAAMLRGGEDFGRIHNNCSGKHTGMLAACCFLGENPRGYIERDHPAQQRWFDSLGDMAGVDLRRLPWNRDGCGIPVVALPLCALATAFARVAAPDDLAPTRADAVERLGSAIAANPFMIAGSGRLGSEIIELCRGRTLVKSGADGVYTAALREKGMGVALKIDDGSGAAAEVALLAVLRRLGGLHGDELALLEERCRVPVRNTRGLRTGYLQVAESLS